MRAMEQTEETEQARAGRVVGRVAALWRYPVKSMAGEALAEAEGSWNGLAGDRRWAFVRAGMERSGFPWLTVREKAELLHYRPRFTEPARPDASETVVETPSGRVLEVTDPQLAAELGEGVRIIKQDRGVFDTAPLSLISTQTLASLSAAVGEPMEALRFRPNLVIEALPQAGSELSQGAAAFPEDAWVGATLWVGELALRIDKRDQRCVMVNIDPVTTARNPQVLRAIASQRQACLGVYGATVRPGRVAVGDAVRLAPAG